MIWKASSNAASRSGEAGDGGHDGLGLWIVSRNMEAMSGSACAENADEGGLVIVLTVPTA